MVSTAKIDEALEKLSAARQLWKATSLAEKIRLLKAVRNKLPQNIQSWGEAGASIRGLKDSPANVNIEAMTSVLAPAMYINKLIETYEALDQMAKYPALPAARTLAGGQKAVQVWPVTASDRNTLPLMGAMAELYLQPGAALAQEAPFLSAAYEPRVCAVLGAGNQGFLGVKDVLVALFERGDVCAFKPHPLMGPWQQFAEAALAPLTQAGVYACLPCESLEETRALLYHPAVQCVHLTGGTATHDAIVWGATPEEQARRRAANDPLLKVPITSELGCVSPVIVTGGDWTEQQLDLHAAAIAGGITFNNSCNCNAFKVLVLPGDWPQADALVAKLKQQLAQCPLPPPYYPGVHARYEAWKAQYPQAEAIRAPAQPSSRADLGPPLPYLVHEMRTLPADPTKEYAFRVEPFAPVFTIVRLPSSGTPDFMARATDFANNVLWGTLSCTLVLHPSVEKAHPSETQQLIQGLRYGVVAINSWSGPAFLVGSSTWGAFVGDQDVKDVGSGIGVIGNGYFVKDIQKAVYRVPIDSPTIPKPVHMQPVPTVVAKAMCGFICDGWTGMFKALVFAR